MLFLLRLVVLVLRVASHGRDSSGPRFSWTPDWDRLPLQRRCPRYPLRSGLCLPGGPHNAATCSSITCCITCRPVPTAKASSPSLAELTISVSATGPRPVRLTPPRSSLLACSAYSWSRRSLPRGAYPKAYHSAGLGWGTVNSKFYETRDNLDGDPQYCLRIYVDWDPEAEEWVVGHVGRHLTTSQS